MDTAPRQSMTPPQDSDSAPQPIREPDAAPHRIAVAADEASTSLEEPGYGYGV